MFADSERTARVARTPDGRMTLRTSGQCAHSADNTRMCMDICECVRTNEQLDSSSKSSANRRIIDKMKKNLKWFNADSAYTNYYPKRSIERACMDIRECVWTNSINHLNSERTDEKYLTVLKWWWWCRVGYVIKLRELIKLIKYNIEFRACMAVYAYDVRTYIN